MAATEPPKDDPPILVAEISRRPSSWRQILGNRRLLLLGLFFVTLFLGLPLLWVSSAFSTGEKIVYTILVLLWTLCVFAVFAWIMWWSYQRIINAL